MQYNFKTIINLGDTVFIIKASEETLNRFSDAYWTSKKIQEIIDGIEESKTSDTRYEWANEDVHLVSIKDEGVFFFDLQALRAGIQSENQDYELDHAEFITFLKDFKTFVEENS